MASFLFSSGRLYLKSGSGTTAQTSQVATLQGVTLSFKSDQKMLYGELEYPVATARAHKTIEGKADFATFDGRLMAAILGGSTSSGSRSIFAKEAKTIDGSNQVTATNTTGWEDLGVWDAAGNPMAQVTSTPALHQYAAAAGVYTFHADEDTTVGTGVTIHYRYTSSTGATTTITNAEMGAQTHFVGVFTNDTDNAGTTERFAIEFFAVAIPSLELTFKADDFAMENVSFTCSANNAGTVYKIYHE